MSNPEPPSALAVAGKSLWSDVVSKYALRADELAILENACRAADMITRVEAAWTEDGCPMYTKGSMGQLVEHPAPKGIRSWQTTMDASLARLKLPDDPAGEKPNQQRDAAQSRWAAAHGASA